MNTTPEKKIKRRVFTSIFSILISAFLLTGCINDSDEDSEDTNNEGTTMMTVSQIAAGNEDFSTLVAALDAANLVETLNGEGPFTVFAPTNAAFDALPDGTVEALLADPEGDLTQILLYHVVSGSVDSETVVTLSEATTVQGGDVTIEVVDGNVILNGSVQVTAVDIEASNGIIHVINAVLIP